MKNDSLMEYIVEGELKDEILNMPSDDKKKFNAVKTPFEMWWSYKRQQLKNDYPYFKLDVLKKIAKNAWLNALEYKR
jgi:hypothetical protein